jgi:hypothetical protein
MTPYRYKNLLYLLAALIVTIGVASCSTSRSTSQSTDTQYQTASVSDRFKALTATYSDWQQINVPIKVAIESPTKLSASGRAYMQRDKYIYISMRFLGMEVANAYIDTDSIIVCDKMNHRYVGESIRDLRRHHLGRPPKPPTRTRIYRRRRHYHSLFIVESQSQRQRRHLVNHTSQEKQNIYIRFYNR